MNNLYKFLNATKTLNDAIPTLINVFCMFSGEDKREYITDKLNHVLLIGYQDLSTMNSLIIQIKNQKSDELIESVFKKYGIEMTKENKEQYCGFSSSLEFPNSFDMITAYQFMESVEIGSEGRRKREEESRYNQFKQYIPELKKEDFLNRNISDDDLKKLPGYIRTQLDYFYEYDVVEERFNKARKDAASILHRIVPEVTEDNIEAMIKLGRLDRLKNMGKSFLEASEEYKQYISENVKPFIDLYEKLHTYRSSVEQKNYYAYLKEFIDYLNEDDKKRVLEEIEKGDLHTFSIPGLGITLGTSLVSIVGLEYFSKKSEETLNKAGANQYRKNLIKENRIKYFKYKGIDLGDNYEDYVNSSECQAIWPSFSDIDYLVKRHDFYENEVNMEFYTGLEFYQEQMNKGVEIGLLDKENVFQPSSYSKKLTAVLPNIVMQDEQYRLYPSVLIFASGEPEADVRLIHELNHLYELSLIGVQDDKKYECICGWDYVGGDINQINVELEDTVSKDESKRNYELFNEIINELLAQKITKMMHENGVYIFGEEGKTKDYGGTSYEHSLFLVREFFDTYLDDIIASRRENNIEIIWNKVGKENFDLMNDLFHEFYEQFPEFEFYALFSDIKKGEVTERTQKFELLKSKRDQVLAKMKEYSLNSKVSL